MAGTVEPSNSKQHRRSTNSDVNMVPMIDLFVVCISFLLITAVWSQTARLDANAQVPGPLPDGDPTPSERTLVVDMTSPSTFALKWRSGSTVHETIDVVREPVQGPNAMVSYPLLAKEVERQWQNQGIHRSDNDTSRDTAVLAVDDHAAFSEIVAVMDAIHRPQRTVHGQTVSAMQVSFATR